jgi:hypothetical protein
VPELNPASVAVSAGTPYLTPQMLLAAPTGIVWSTVGAGSRPTEQQQFNEQVNLCRRATSMIDGYCNQPLRATVDVETLYGPGDLRFQMSPNGNARLLLSRSPVTQVLGGLVSAAASFPPQFTTVPPQYFKIEKPLIGVYGTTVPGGSDNAGQAVLLAPGYVGWYGGRMGWQVQVAYVNGWPHASLQAPAAAGDMTLSVDDCTGWGPPAPYYPQAGSSVTTVPQLPGQLSIPQLAQFAGTGAAGTLYDPGSQEAFTVLAASAVSGPGVLTLAGPLAYEHAVGVMTSTLPNTIIQAAILYCVSQALVRGATSTSVQALPGTGTSGGEKTADEYAAEADLLCHPYRRII